MHIQGCVTHVDRPTFKTYSNAKGFESLWPQKGHHGGLNVSRHDWDAIPTLNPSLRHFQSSEIKNEDRLLTLKGRGYFTNKKDGGGGHYGPHVYLVYLVDKLEKEKIPKNPQTQFFIFYYLLTSTVPMAIFLVKAVKSPQNISKKSPWKKLKFLWMFRQLNKKDC